MSDNVLIVTHGLTQDCEELEQVFGAKGWHESWRGLLYSKPSTIVKFITAEGATEGLRNCLIQCKEARRGAIVPSAAKYVALVTNLAPWTNSVALALNFKPTHATVEDGVGILVFDSQKHTERALNRDGIMLAGRSITIKLLENKLEEWDGTLMFCAQNIKLECLHTILTQCGSYVVVDVDGNNYKIRFNDLRDAYHAVCLNGTILGDHKSTARKQSNKQPTTVARFTIEITSAGNVYIDRDELWGLLKGYGSDSSYHGAKNCYTLVLSDKQCMKCVLALNGHVLNGATLQVKLITPIDAKPTPSNKLLVGGLCQLNPKVVTEAFEKYGEVKSIRPRLMYEVEYLDPVNATVANKEIHGCFEADMDVTFI